MMGAIALNEGNVAQMYTGEGKTIIIAFLANVIIAEYEVQDNNFK